MTALTRFVDRITHPIASLARVPLNLEPGARFTWRVPETGKQSTFVYRVTALHVTGGKLLVDGCAMAGAGMVRVTRPVEDITLLLEDVA